MLTTSSGLNKVKFGDQNRSLEDTYYHIPVSQVFTRLGHTGRTSPSGNRVKPVQDIHFLGVRLHLDQGKALQPESVAQEKVHCVVLLSTQSRLLIPPPS